MSTKESLKHHRDEQTGGWFHLYRECFDEERSFVYLELGGVPFEASSSGDISSGADPGSVAVRIPEAWARKLGLVGPPEERPAAAAAPEGEDEYARWLLDQRGTVDKDIDLEQ